MQSVGMLLALCILIGGVTIQSSVEMRAQRAIAVFLFTVILWLTNPVPVSISSVLSMVLLPTLGVVDSFDAAVGGFASRLVFFLLLLFLIGDTISTVNLDEHVAGHLLSSSSTPRRSYQLLVRNVLWLSFIMPSGIARTVTFAPVVQSLNRRYEIGRTNNFLRSSFLLLGQLNPIASLALMTGGGMAILSSEIIRTAVTPITWLEWALYMTPPIVFVYTVSAVTLARLYPINDTETVGEIDHDAGLSREQRIVAAVIAATILLWIVGSIVGLSTIVPPMLAVVVLAAPGVRIITSADVRDVNWGVLLLFGAVFSLIDALTATGAMQLIIQSLLDLIPLETFPAWLALTSILGGVLLLRLVFSTASACLAITLPVTMSLASSLALHPLFTAFSVVIVVASTTLLPFHLPTVLIVKEEYPTLRNRDVFVVGLLALSVSTVAIALSWTFYWPML